MIMNNLSEQQKIAVMRILFDIINADGRIDAREMFFFHKISAMLGLSNEDLDIVREANSLLSLLEIKGFDNEQKIEVAKLMGEQIVVDEDINVNEMAIFEFVCSTCGIDIKFSDVVSEEVISNSTRS